MNAQEAIAILEMQRESFLIDADKYFDSDYDKWCRAKAKDFQDIIDWLNKEVSVEVDE